MNDFSVPMRLMRFMNDFSVPAPSGRLLFGGGKKRKKRERKEVVGD